LLQFEDKPAQLIGTTSQPVGTEGDLNYQSFSIGTTGLDGSGGGVAPASQKNTATASGVQQLTSTFVITTTGTNVEAFDLTSFYFGCTLVTAGTTSILGGVNTGCSVEVRAFGTEGQQVPSQAFGFAPLVLASRQDTVLAFPMAKALLPASFSNLVNVSFAVDTSATTDGTTFLQLDNVAHVNYYPS